jgi:hypothetical protein
MENIIEFPSGFLLGRAGLGELIKHRFLWVHCIKSISDKP